MEKRSDTLRFSDAEVRLFLGARRIADGQAGIVCDRMVVLVQEFMGNEEDVVIYRRDGKRRIGQLRMMVVLGSDPPPTSKRLLAVYDKFATRTWAQ